MKKRKYLGLSLSLAFFLTGSYLLQDSIHSSGQFAEDWILIGAFLAALSLPAAAWSLNAHAQTRALERHMKSR